MATAPTDPKKEAPHTFGRRLMPPFGLVVWTAASAWLWTRMGDVRALALAGPLRAFAVETTLLIGVVWGFLLLVRWFGRLARAGSGQ